MTPLNHIDVEEATVSRYRWNLTQWEKNYMTERLNDFYKHEPPLVILGNSILQK